MRHSPPPTAAGPSRKPQGVVAPAPLPPVPRRRVVPPALLSLFLAALGVGVFLSGAEYSPPGEAAAPDEDLHEAPPLADQFKELRDQGRRLDTRLAVHLNRQEAKRRVAGELVAGRLTLLEAAARFRDLNAAEPTLVEGTCLTWGGRPYEECLCRSVLKYVRTGGHHDLADRLEAELRKCVKDGSLRLPG